VTRALVLTAIDVEARGLARRLGLSSVRGSSFAHFSGGALEIAAVGLRAGRLAERASAFAAHDLVLSAGVCAALAPALGVGDLVVPSAVLGVRGERWTAAVLGRLPADGVLVTVANVLESPADKARLWMETGAMAADMESAAVLAWALGRGVPAAVVRAVSDGADSGVPAALAGAVGEDGRVRPLRAVTAALTRASTVGAMLELRAGTDAALKTVAGALATLARSA